MEILPSVKIQRARIPILYKPYCLFDSKDKSILKGVANSISSNKCLQIEWRKPALNSSYNDIGSTTHPGLQNMPFSVDLLPISSEAQFDRVVAEAQQLEESVVVLWMARWCRKCIYLKPKLEKLAADYYPRVRFYSVDVNNVPHRLVIRAGVTKMPTIQLWRDGKKQEEVIGGHRAYLVVNEVREIIENENSSI